MKPFSISFYHLTSSIKPKTHNLSLTKTLSLTTNTSSPPASETYWTHLEKSGPCLEKTLNTVRAKLDPSCVNQVLQKCAIDNKPHMGLRFFIWAGLKHNYRHSAYMYRKACELLEINRNPKLVFDVIEEKFLFSAKMFKVVLNLCREAKNADMGLWVLRKMKEFNCKPDTTSYNVVIRLFCEEGGVDVAMGLIREMGLVDLYPDMITYVMMVKGFCDLGRLEDASVLFKVMRGHGCVPNTVVYSALLDGVHRFGSTDRAMELLEEMEKEGGVCKPNVVTYTSVIQRFCEKGRAMEALSILDRMNAFGCAPNRVTIGTLIEGLCIEEQVQEAYKLIDKVVAGGSVTDDECHNSLVLSLLRIKRLEEAEKIFRRMLANGLKPNGVASSTFINVLCSKGRVLDGFSLYDEMEKLKCLPSIDSNIYSILLVGLCHESHLVEAAKLAKLMVVRGIQLKAPYVDDIVEHLKNAGEKELVSNIAKIGRC